MHTMLSSYFPPLFYLKLTIKKPGSQQVIKSSTNCILQYFGIYARHALPLWSLSWASQKLRDSPYVNGEPF